MDIRKKRRITLTVELLEDRTVPAYLAVNPGPFTVLGQSDNGYTGAAGWQFQLQASIVTTSDRFGVTLANGNGQWWAVNSTPSPFAQITQPNPQWEWDTLIGTYPNLGWAFSGQTLADNSLIIKDAEAVGPSRLTAADASTNPRFGQSLSIQYNPNPGNVANPTNPPANSVHWIQFLTTINWDQQPGTIYEIDNGGAASPFYDSVGTADGTGFFDLPANPIPNNPANYLPVTFEADLFLFQHFDNYYGHPAEVAWQGISWGWTTAQAAPPAGAPRGRSGGGGYTGTVGGDGFTDATNVSFSVVPANSFTGNSDTLITARMRSEAIGTVDIPATDSGSVSLLPSAYQFTYVSNASVGTSNTVTSLESSAYTVAAGNYYSIFLQRPDFVSSPEYEATDLTL
jgi:hypothetical protein